MNDKELKIVDVLEGQGVLVQKGALLIVNYIGTLSDKSVFESSFDKGKPFQFVYGTGKVIKGWDLGLAGMRVGGKRTLFIPSHLAYGERSVGKIPPHSDLFFEVELLEARLRE